MTHGVARNRVKIARALDEQGVMREAAEFRDVENRPRFRCEAGHQLRVHAGHVLTPHFAHVADGEEDRCWTTSPETAAHYNAKHAIAEALNKQPGVPFRVIAKGCSRKHGFSHSFSWPTVRWTHAIVEARINTRRPDVVLVDGETPVAAIEVMYSHEVDARKRKDLTIPWVEVHARDVSFPLKTRQHSADVQPLIDGDCWSCQQVEEEAHRRRLEAEHMELVASWIRKYRTRRRDVAALEKDPPDYRVAVGVAMDGPRRAQCAVGFMIMRPGAKIHVGILEPGVDLAYIPAMRYAYEHVLRHIRIHGRGLRYNLHGNEATDAQFGSTSFTYDIQRNVADLCIETRALLVRTSTKQPSEEATYILRCVEAAREHLRLTRALSA